MRRSLKLLLSLGAVSGVIALAAGCGTAADGEGDALRTDRAAPDTAVVAVQPAEAAPRDGMADGHMTGAANVAHEEGDAHEAAMHADASEAAQTIEVTAYEWGFDQPNIDIPAGVPVKLVLKNEGKLEHEIQLVIPGAETVSPSGVHEGDEAPDHAEMAMSGDNGVIHVHTGPGETSSTVFIADAAGRYEFACEIPGHRSAGMVGQVYVMPTGG